MVRKVIRVSRQAGVSTGGVCGLGYSAVWCPRYGRPVLAGWVAARCMELIRAKANEHRLRLVAVEIMPNQARLLVKAHLSGSLSRVAANFRGFISRCMRAGILHLRSCLPILWSRLYFAAAVGALPAESARRHTSAHDERPWRKELVR